MSHLKYFVYVVKHKWFVFLECLKYGLFMRGVFHDWSKFRLSEWVPYVDFTQRGLNKAAFKIAVQQHYNRNDHHWEYWLDSHDGTPYPMPDNCKKEMIADWRAMGRVKGNTAVSFYSANKDRIILHPDTREWVEKELNSA